MSEEHIEIPRRARYATLGGPGEELREIWILCHGYGQLARRPMAGRNQLRREIHDGESRLTTNFRHEARAC